jgi:toxin ParE1/3/4
MEVLVRHDAELDALAFFQCLIESNPDAAVTFLEAIDRTIEGLARQPFKGRPRRFRGRDLRNIRSWRVDDFENYLLFYRIEKHRLEILRIRHGAMKLPQALRRK